MAVPVLSALVLGLGTWVWRAEGRLQTLEESTVSREVMTDLMVEYRMAQIHRRDTHEEEGPPAPGAPDHEATPNQPDMLNAAAVFAREQFIRGKK